MLALISVFFTAMPLHHLRYPTIPA